MIALVEQAKAESVANALISAGARQAIITEVNFSELPILYVNISGKQGLAQLKDIADKLSDKELQLLVFRPGASTNEIITDISGRGVGMDVVMTKVRELGGNVRMESTVGKGTTVTMELPLTLAIINSLLVRVKDEIYAMMHEHAVAH